MSDRSRVGPESGREIEALLAAALWVFGFVVAPLAHVASHGALTPHTHDGHRVIAADDAHCHGAECHAHENADGQSVSGHHGAHSLLHQGVAAETPLPGAPRVPVAAIFIARYASDTPSVPTTRSRETARARGPPA